MVIAAILGAGRGTRAGTELPKQFARLGDEPVLLHSLRACLQSGLTDACLLLVPADYADHTRELLRCAGLAEAPVTVLAGGESRGDTLLKALEHVKAVWGLKDTVLLTHDAARPFITRRMIEENIAAAREYGAANTCVPATDTVVLSDDGAFITSVPPRSRVFHAQTPQTFMAEKLYGLIQSMPAAEFAALTDGCSVFTRCALPVYMARGSENNIKITYPGDLKRAEQILLQTREQERAPAAGK